jgi:hypothetical protein
MEGDTYSGWRDPILWEGVVEVRDLKGYGKSWADALTDMPRDVEIGIRRTSRKIITRHLGAWNLLRLPLLFVGEHRRMSKVDLSHVREKGLTNEKFIKSQIEFNALYSAVSRLIGRERTMEIFKEIMEATAVEVFECVWAGREDFVGFDDPWAAFREYARATAKADNETGGHFFQVVEDTEEAIQMNVTYCAWYEIARALGVKEACLASCYSDDIGMPAMGIRFQRTQTIAAGAACCDFRFLRPLD